MPIPKGRGPRLSPAAVQYVLNRMGELGLNQQQVAKEAGFDKGALSRLLKLDEDGTVTLETLERLAAALDTTVGAIVDAAASKDGANEGQASVKNPPPLSSSVKPPTLDGHENVHDGVIEQRQGDGGWPVYDGTGCGNPVAVEESLRPVPVRTEILTGEKAAVIGPNGFGVRVRGESMSMWEFHEGDVVWVNPDRACRYNWPNLYLIQRDDGQWGMCVKVLKSDGLHDYLTADGTSGKGDPVFLDGREDIKAVGPVMRHDRSNVPRRRDILEDQANIVDVVRRIG